MLEISEQKFIFAKSICLVPPDPSCSGKLLDALLIYILIREVPLTEITNQEKFAVIKSQERDYNTIPYLSKQ